MTLAFSAFVVFGAFLGQTIFGFGGGLLAIPLLSLLLPVQDAICVALVFQLFIGLILVKTWIHTPWEVLRPLIPSIAVGSLIGAYLLAQAPEFLITLLLLLFIITFLTRARLFPDMKFPILKKPVWATASGILGGFVQGVLGTGGPIFVIYLNETVEDKSSFRAAIVLILIGCNLLRLMVAMPTGLFSDSVVEIALVSIPGFLIALLVGERLHVSISQKAYRSCIELLLLLSAISLATKLII